MPLILTLLPAFLVGLFAGLPVDDAAANWTRGYPQCTTDDSAGPCYWDDGHGARYVVEPAGDPQRTTTT